MGKESCCFWPFHYREISISVTCASIFRIRDCKMDGKHEDIHAQHVERDGSDVEANNEKSEPDLIDEPTITGHATDFVEDKERSRRLRWKVDLKFLPICGFVYLLNYLDRGNIGAARILNSETGDDILQTTNTTPNGYAVAVSLFSVAYAEYRNDVHRYGHQQQLRRRWIAHLAV